jgi:hypothetical protein
MKERLRLGGCVEIALLCVKIEVGRHQRGISELLSKLLEFLGRDQYERGDQRRNHDHQEKRRQYPQNPPCPKVAERKPALLQRREDLIDDQVAGDDEEDVHADEAPGKARDAGMVCNDADDRDCPQAVHRRLVSGREAHRSTRKNPPGGH